MFDIKGFFVVHYSAVFDSGLGGLSVFQRLREAYPQQNFIFFADNAQLPLGDKTPQYICQVSVRATKFLTSQEGICDAMIIACGTACSYALSTVISKTSIPVLDVIHPVVQKVFAQANPKKIGVLATQASISAGMYEEEIKKHSPNCQIFAKAAPELVPLIESGNYEALKPVLTQYLTFFPQDLEVLILGCTHYTLIKELTQQYMPQTQVLALANPLVENFSPYAREGEGSEIFFCSSKTPTWEAQAARVLGRDVSWVQIDPDNIK
ncbi:MAG: glutamate racemase [Brevinema sp.]